MQEEGQQLPSWQGTRQMVESLRVSAARGRYVEARLLISCMSTPSSVQDGAQAGRFSAPRSADLLLMHYHRQCSCNCCCSTASLERRKRSPKGWLET